MGQIISCSDIYKSYGDLAVLKGINLQIKAGEVVAIVGPSGAGKTTLLHILSTLDRADSNEKSQLQIEGVSVSEMGAAEMAQFSKKPTAWIYFSISRIASRIYGLRKCMYARMDCK